MEVLHYFRGRIATMILFTQIILAHLIGDFYLQSKTGIAQKEIEKWRSPFLYFHATIHFALILMVTWNPTIWFPALLITAAHLLIDGLKLQLQNHQNRIAWFFGDQLLHLLSIFLVWYFLLRGTAIPAYPFANFYWFVFTGAVLATRPIGIVIGVLLADQRRRLDNSAASLPWGTQTIGNLERLLVFIFILSGQRTAIVLVMLAKLIYVFIATRKSSTREVNNFLIIATSLSFILATATGFGVIFLIGEALEIGLYL